MKIDKKLPLLVFRCVALGLGLAVLTLLGIDKIEPKEALWMLSLAVSCLAACSLGEYSQKNNDEK